MGEQLPIQIASALFPVDFSKSLNWLTLEYRGYKKNVRSTRIEQLNEGLEFTAVLSELFPAMPQPSAREV
jgi:hypothetical protein